MGNKELEEFEITLISQSAKRLFTQGFTVDEILGKIADGISKMASELTAEELYRNEKVNHLISNAIHKEIKEQNMNELLELGYFKEDLETLKENIEAIKKGSFARNNTHNYSSYMNTAYNKILQYAVEFRACGYLINEGSLRRKAENDKTADGLIMLIYQLISIL